MTFQAAPTSTLYRGSSKHKNRPADERKGTLCPEWTHQTKKSGFATDVHAHEWAQTQAAELFAGAMVDPSNHRRYATMKGIAFEAKPTADGTWHGFPIPWESVPSNIKNAWVEKDLVSPRQIKKFLSFDKSNIHWAMMTDSQ